MPDVRSLLPAPARGIHRDFLRLPPPVIVIGMHRSGTSLVAGMLSLLGVYMDPALDLHPGTGADEIGLAMRATGYGEAMAFRRVNESLLDVADSRWDCVDGFLAQRDERLFAALSVLRLRLATFGRLRAGFLTLRPDVPGGAWGFKDPRTSLTLPYWLRLFPQARVLHVRRDVDAVIASLIRRESSRGESAEGAVDWRPPLTRRLARKALNPAAALRYAARRAGLGSAPCWRACPPQTFDDWMRLCGQYLRECVAWRSLGSQYLEVRYERILDDPMDAAARLADFARVKATDRARRCAALLVDSRHAGGAGREPSPLLASRA